MTAQPSDCILANARLVLADRVIERGWVAMSDGRIAEFGEGDAPRGSEDAAGDLIMPGLIELHTDHLEMRTAIHHGKMAIQRDPAETDGANFNAGRHR